jgi:fluoride exporter
MYHYLLVGIGGGLGAIARAGLGGLILHRSVDWRFPLGTFIVNVLGCLIGGVLAGLIARYEYFSPQTRVFLFTGFLGGFTTFSAFSLETVTLIRQGSYGVAVSYVLLSVIAGTGALAVAMTIIDPPGHS